MPVNHHKLSKALTAMEKGGTSETIGHLNVAGGITAKDKVRGVIYVPDKYGFEINGNKATLLIHDKHTLEVLKEITKRKFTRQLKQVKVARSILYEAMHKTKYPKTPLLTELQQIHKILAQHNIVLTKVTRMQETSLASTTARFHREYHIGGLALKLKAMGVEPRTIAGKILEQFPTELSKGPALRNYDLNTEANLVSGAEFAREHDLENEVQNLQTQGLDQREIVDKLRSDLKKDGLLQNALNYLGYTTESGYVTGAVYAKNNKLQQALDDLNEQFLDEKKYIDKLMHKFKQPAGLQQALKYLGYAIESNLVTGAQYAQQHKIQEEIHDLKEQELTEEEIAKQLLKTFEEHRSLYFALIYLGEREIVQKGYYKTKPSKIKKLRS